MAKLALQNRVTSTYQQSVIAAICGQIETQVNGLSEGRIAARYFTASVVPTTGSFSQGDIVWDANASVSASVAAGVAADYIRLGWICTADGSPGTLQEIRVLVGSGAGVSGQPAGAIQAYAGFTAPSGWLMCFGQNVSRTTYAALWAAIARTSTVTMTIASPCVVAWTGNTLQNNDPIDFRTSGALPTGLTAGTVYYVKSLSGDTFNVSSTPGGTAINTSGTQSGTHTGVNAPYGDGDGSTTFGIPDLRGRVLVGRDALGGTAANRVTSSGSGINGDSPGGTGGAETVTLTTSTIPGHTHNVGMNGAVGGAANAGWGPSNALTSFIPTNNGSADGGSGGAHNNMPPSLIVNYIIKT